MKKVNVLFVLVLLVGLMTGCSKEETQTDEINGTWHLKNVSGGLLGINYEYLTGDVKWTFDDSTNKVKVENTVPMTRVEYSLSGPASGTYIYEVKVNGAESLLYIDNNIRGVITIDNTTLTLDDGVDADGYYTVLIR